MNMRTGVAFTATVLVGLALTACGSDGSGEGDAAGGEQGDEMSPEELQVAWTECLRDEGIEILDPDVEGEGVPIDELVDLGDLTEEEADAAFERCQELYPTVPDMDDEEWFQLELEFAECMRDEGIDYPDPLPGGGASEIPDEDDVDEGEFDAAARACSEVFDVLEDDAA